LDAAEIYALSGLNRADSDFYTADSGSDELMIETRFCSAYPYNDDGYLAVLDNGTVQMIVDDSSSDVCDVAGVYVAAPAFGAYELTGIQREAANIYRAKSGLIDLIIQTRYCYEYPVFDDGVLVWNYSGSQLLIEDSSSSACDVVNVYSH
jgi:hypothetical protein